MKGALLILAAVVIGFVLLHTAPRAQTETTVGTSVTATTKAPKSSKGGTASATTSAPTTTAAPAHTASAVSVVVANGTGVPHLAGTVRGQLNAAGYNTAKPAINSPTTTASTEIYYIPGYQADALNIANVLTLGAGSVFAMPTPPPVPAADIAGIDVLVIAGNDISGTSGASSSSGTTEAPPGNTIAPSPTVASGGTATTAAAPATTAAATATTLHTETTEHTATTVGHTPTTA
jgi:hypothetical protein